jgi:AcrR family transcriptional regulator
LALEVRRLVGRLPPAPPVGLDRHLDAAARCFSRYGVSRTTVVDVARELRVTRATVYRRAGPIDHLARQLFTRELHRLLAELSGHLEGRHDAGAVVEVIAVVVDRARSHPVMAKVLADEPELARSLLMGRLDEVIELAAPLLEPLVGNVTPERSVDARASSELLARLAVSLVLVPVDDVPAFLAAALRPLLGDDR